MKRSFMIALVLVTALALTGLAFAAWTANVEIIGTVSTGTFRLEFGDGPSTNDSGTADDPGLDPPQHIGQTEVLREADKLSLTVTVTNAYPGYGATVTYTLKNAGTVPLKITSVETSGGAAGVLTLDTTNAGLDEIIPTGTTTGSHSISFTCGDDIVQGKTGGNAYVFTVTLTGSLYLE